MEINDFLNGPGNTLLVVKRDDLIEFAKTYANKIIDSKPEPIKVQEAEQPISQNEAAKFLGKSRQTMIAWRKKGIIKGHVLSGRVFFLKSELLEALKA